MLSLPNTLPQQDPIKSSVVIITSPNMAFSGRIPLYRLLSQTGYHPSLTLCGCWHPSVRCADAGQSTRRRAGVWGMGDATLPVPLTLPHARQEEAVPSMHIADPNIYKTVPGTVLGCRISTAHWTASRSFRLPRLPSFPRCICCMRAFRCPSMRAPDSKFFLYHEVLLRLQCLPQGA